MATASDCSTRRGRNGSASTVSTCPEEGQDFETKAKHTTSLLVFAKVVDVQTVSTDRYGRTVVFVRMCTTLVNEDLIRRRVTWMFTLYRDWTICEEREVLAAEAQEKRRGLWSMPNTIPPWEFRRSAGRRQSQRFYGPSLHMTEQEV